MAGLLAREFGQAADRQVETAPRREGDRVDPATGLAIAALVLALPGAIKDGLDIAEKVGLLERLRRLIGAAQEQKREHGVTIRLDTGSGLKDITVMTEGEVLDALVVVRRKG